MGMFSKKKEMFITTERTPAGYESLGLVTGIGADSSKKRLCHC
ncbi:hypothetical protein [Lactiplantibacillus modestisalitolerans]|nr:hypothetical protein [Lactiplantibacillus modestisalitolerans]